MTTREVQALVLEVEEYKENDGLVTVLLENERKTIYAKGIQKITSKNRMLCQPFSFVSIFIDEKENRMPLLLHGNVIRYYFHIQEDLLIQGICFILKDCIKAVQTSPKIFTFLNKTWEAFHLGEANAYTFACLTLKECCKSEGIEMYVKGCVKCGRRNRIETISLVDGGFLCIDCNHDLYPKWSKEKLIQFYSLMHVKDEQIERFTNEMLMNIEDLIFLATWFEHYSGVSLKSLSFLKKIKNMN